MSPPSWLLAASNLGATRRSPAWDILRVGTSRSCPRDITFANMLWPVGWRATAYDHCLLQAAPAIMAVGSLSFVWRNRAFRKFLAGAFFRSPAILFNSYLPDFPFPLLGPVFVVT